MAEPDLGKSLPHVTVEMVDHPDQYLPSLAAKGRSLLFSQYAH
jgi:hypothetical protein